MKKNSLDLRRNKNMKKSKTGNVYVPKFDMNEIQNLKKYTSKDFKVLESPSTKGYR